MDCIENDKVESVLKKATINWLLENEVEPDTVEVTAHPPFIEINIKVTDPYVVDDVDELELECHLGTLEGFEEFNYDVSVYDGENWDDRLAEGVPDDPDALNDEDETDALHDVEEGEEDEEDDFDVELDDEVQVERYEPDDEDLKEFEE